ncbi:DUF3955 domain-containing protein [Vibrio mediterranei]
MSAGFKRYWIPLCLNLIGWSFGIGYFMIGHYFNKQGDLVEPFLLIPLFYIFQVVSMVFILVMYSRS